LTADAVFDATGKYVIPGGIDVHPTWTCRSGSAEPATMHSSGAAPTQENGGNQCHFDRSSGLFRQNRLSKARAFTLRRAFGFGDTSEFDPFLLLDDFRNDIPEEYLAGFPWHPHRGIETITYVLAGSVEHGDSMGNRGSITSATSSG